MKMFSEKVASVPRICTPFTNKHLKNLAASEADFVVKYSVCNGEEDFGSKNKRPKKERLYIFNHRIKLILCIVV